ncbi:MAG: acyltransferase, partial [Maricaulis sp.]|nr:acyltransferase [Maricaulis sp.]
MTSKLSNIQGLRAIAVLLVLAVHIQYNEARTDAEALLTPWLLHGVAGVDLFFVISGFVMVWITSSPDRSINIARFLFNRAARIYPAAWLWTTVAILGFAAAGTLGMWLEQSGLVFSYLLLPQEN